jgi:hypothetical protein
MKTEFWTMYYYGSSEVICSQHKSFDAALRAAIACENRGGADHRILMVREALPYKPPLRPWRDAAIVERARTQARRAASEG